MSLFTALLSVQTVYKYYRIHIILVSFVAIYISRKALTFSRR